MAFTKIAAAGIGSTELVTLHSLEVLNNATVGGVLTYEDVTNVDSIGIITARAGVLVGSGITLSKDGDIFATGVTTTGSLVSSGAISGTTGTFSGAISGTTGTFSGAVSGTTGTFSGAVSGTTGTFSGATSIDGTLTVSSVDAGATGPTLKLFHNSASPADNDVVSRISMVGDDDAGNETEYARIDAIAKDVSNTGEDGNLTISTIQDSSFAERLRIDSAGRVLIGGTSAIIGSESEFAEIVLTGKTKGAGITLQDVDANVRFQIRTDDDASGTLGTLLNASTNHPIVIRTNNSERLRIYGNGAVLIGADSGEAGGDAKLAIDCQGLNIFDGVGDAANYGLIFANDPTTNKANGIGFFNDSASTCGGYIVHQDKGSGNIGDLVFGTSATSDTPVERLRITGDGYVNVGDGTDSPYAPLHVYAENSFGLNAMFGKGFVNNAAYHYDDANVLFAGQDVDGNHTGAGIEFITRNVANSNWFHGAITMNRYGALHFTTGGLGTSAGTVKGVLTSGGKFSIGNPAEQTPTRLLYVDCGTTGDGMRIVSDEVMGDFVINNTGDSYGRAFVINASRMDSGSYPKLHLAGQGSITFAVDANSTRMTIDSSGNIGAPSGNNIYNASDERLKENMIDLTNGLDKINKLKPVSFTWKNGWSESLDGVTQYGFGAQTTQSVDELLVEPFSTGDVELNGETIENPLRVNEKHIIPLLVKAIQELSAKVDALEG